MDHLRLSGDPTTHDTPATIAWSAAETDAFSEPPFTDEAFCIQLVVLSGERHIYRLKRETLTQLFARISEVLARPDKKPLPSSLMQTAERHDRSSASLASAATGLAVRGPSWVRT